MKRRRAPSVRVPKEKLSYGSQFEKAWTVLSNELVALPAVFELGTESFQDYGGNKVKRAVGRIQFIGIAEDGSGSHLLTGRVTLQVHPAGHSSFSRGLYQDLDKLQISVGANCPYVRREPGMRHYTDPVKAAQRFRQLYDLVVKALDDEVKRRDTMNSTEAKEREELQGVLLPSSWSVKRLPSGKYKLVGEVSLDKLKEMAKKVMLG